MFHRLTAHWEKHKKVRAIAYMAMALHPALHFAPQIWPIQSHQQGAIALCVLFFGWLGWQPKKTRKRFELVIFCGLLFFLIGLGGGDDRQKY